MATITIHTDDALLNKLERIAEVRHTTLDEVVTDMLSRQAETESGRTAYDELMDRLRPLGPLPKLSREERNER
jgi:predicted transcriptional regulator